MPDVRLDSFVDSVLSTLQTDLPRPVLTSLRGIEPDDFFDGYAHHDPLYIDGADLHPLLRASLHHQPIDLSSGEMVWLYKVWQNEHAKLHPHVPTLKISVPGWK